MSQAVLEQIQNEADTSLETTACDRDVYTYASTEPLKVIGACKMRVLVKETGKSTDAMFVIIPGRYVTLLGRSTSEVLGILKVGLQVNGCDMQYKSFPELKEKYPEVFTGLGKLNDYQLKLHIDDSVAPVAQAVRRIPFSLREHVIDKLAEFEHLDVVEEEEKRPKTKQTQRKKQTSEPAGSDSKNADEGSVRKDDANGDACDASENSDYDDTDMHDHLSEWFTIDESHQSKESKRQLPVTKEQLYKEQLKLFDALPITKIPEARARKKQKSTQKVEKVRKKAKPIHRRKCRQKQYADERRAAKTTDIEGDKMLLGQRRETKLSPHFEPNPYRVIEKDGNAIVIQDAQGQTKMRNVGQMTKFVEADPVVMFGASQGETVDNPSDETFTETELSLTLNPVTSVTPSPVKLSLDGSRAQRQKSAPRWLQDFVV